MSSTSWVHLWSSNSNTYVDCCKRKYSNQAHDCFFFSSLDCFLCSSFSSDVHRRASDVSSHTHTHTHTSSLWRSNFVCFPIDRRLIIKQTTSDPHVSLDCSSCAMLCSSSSFYLSIYLCDLAFTVTVEKQQQQQNHVCACGAMSSCFLFFAIFIRVTEKNRCRVDEDWSVLFFLHCYSNFVSHRLLVPRFFSLLLSPMSLAHNRFQF